MSLASSDAVQKAFYGLLSGDAAISALIGGAIYDDLPAGDVSGTFVTLGGEEVRDRSHQTGSLVEHRITVSVVSDAEGFRAAKEVAGAVTDALSDARPALTRGRVVGTTFFRARARRLRTSDRRRIDMTFRVLVEDN